MWHYALPVTIFAYCYSRIFRVVRRQGKVVSSQAGTADTATATRERNARQVQQQATGATTTDHKLSRIQLNILETMIAVIVCFVVCWAPSSLANIIQSTTVCPLFYRAMLCIAQLFLTSNVRKARSNLQSGPKKVSQTIFAITLSTASQFP